MPEQSRKAREAGKPAVPAMGAITEEEEERESKSKVTLLNALFQRCSVTPIFCMLFSP